MNVNKAQLKIALLTELGADFEDQKEAAERDLFRWEGAITAYGGALKKIEEHRTVYADLVDKGEMDLDQHKLVMRTIDRCMGICESLRLTAEAQKVAKGGGVDALEKNVKYLESMRQKEIVKVEEVKRLLDSNELSDEQKQELLSGRPSLSVVSSPAEDIQQRREEARKAKEARAQDESADEQPEQPSESTEAQASAESESEPNEDTGAGQRPSRKRRRSKSKAPDKAPLFGDGGNSG